MATLPTLVPTADLSLGTWTDALGGTTNIYTSIDETIAGANDLDYVQGPAGTASAAIFSLTDMPADLSAMLTLTVNFRYCQIGRVDDTLGLNAIAVEAPDGTNYATASAIAGITSATFINSGALSMTMTAAGLAASRTDWNAAQLTFQQSYTTSMGDDAARVKVSAVEVTGTYTPSVVAIPNKSFRLSQAVNRSASY